MCGTNAFTNYLNLQCATGVNAYYTVKHISLKVSVTDVILSFKTYQLYPRFPSESEGPVASTRRNEVSTQHEVEVISQIASFPISFFLYPLPIRVDATSDRGSVVYGHSSLLRHTMESQKNYPELLPMLYANCVATASISAQSKAARHDP